MVVLEILYNSGMHITKLATVAFVKDNNDMLIVNLMIRILLYESSQFLNRSNNNTTFFWTSF